MTFSLRRKRRTTAPARSTPSRTACSLAGLAALLAGGLASAANPVTPTRAPAPIEPIFVSSSKPLPNPPAALAKPVVAVEAPAPAPTKPQPQPQPQPQPKPVASMTPIKQVQAQVVDPPSPMIGDATSVSDALRDYQILLESPSPEMLFGKLDSEKMLEKRMRQQALQRNPPDNVQFPYNPPLTKDKYQARNLAHSTIYEEPNFVVYNRLYFEDKNAERYGWSLGAIQPVASTLQFYKDVALFPIRAISPTCPRFDTNAGQCLPGDPVPYLIYPPEINVLGCLFSK